MCSIFEFQQGEDFWKDEDTSCFEMFEFNVWITPLASSLLCPHTHSPSHDHLHHLRRRHCTTPPHPNATPTSTLPTDPCRLLMNVTGVSPGWPS